MGNVQFADPTTRTKHISGSSWLDAHRPLPEGVRGGQAVIFEDNLQAWPLDAQQPQAVADEGPAAVGMVQVPGLNVLRKPGNTCCMRAAIRAHQVSSHWGCLPCCSHAQPAAVALGRVGCSGA